jgi:hypothetical protein
MEVQRQTVDERSRTVDLTRQNRERIAASNPPLSPADREVAGGDRVDVSTAGRQIAERAADPAADRADERRRSERLRELAEARERGELNSDERVERAAVRLLERL